MEIKSLSIAFGDRIIFKDFNLQLKSGVTAIMGGSGIGKTTLLKAVAGLIDYSGEISSKKIGYVFQEPRLIPNLTVLQNVSLVCNADKAKDVLELVELSSVKNYYPKQLSGGMAQRVNLARAFCVGQDILLDEAFKGLDYSLKHRLMQSFKQLFNRENTALFITHDIDEALFLADRIIVLNNEPAEIVLDVSTKQEKVKEMVLNQLNKI